MPSDPEDPVLDRRRINRIVELRNELADLIGEKATLEAIQEAAYNIRAHFIMKEAGFEVPSHIQFKHRMGSLKALALYAELIKAMTMEDWRP